MIRGYGLSRLVAENCGKKYCRYYSLEIPEELEQFYKGRGRCERSDSITINLLQQRKKHYERLSQLNPSLRFVSSLESQGFGQKKQLTNVYGKGVSYSYFDENDEHVTGAGGHAVHVASASGSPWPIFKHLLPEIAFAGHSNSGKV